jgi:RNA polymerase sigma factor (sigma-70 family)
MVQSKIKRYKPMPFYGDLLQEGRIGIIRAIELFDATKGLNFFTFLSWHIRSRIANFLAWHKRNSMHAKRGFSHHVGESFSPHEHYEKEEQKRVLISEVKRLPDMDREVVMMRFGICGYDNHTLRQIGNKFSLSRERIRQIESRAMLKLRKNKNIKHLVCGI